MYFSDTSPITFPGLGIEINPSDGFSVFGFEIKWYGVIIALGLLLAVLYCTRRCRQFGLTSDDILNIVIVGLPCAVIGARLYYVLFSLDAFFGPGIPWYRIFDIRQGGLAIYGGVIGAAVGIVLFFFTSPKRRKKLLPSFDVSGLGLLIGQSVGRWGNFFNREAHGGETTSLLRMGLIEGGRQIYVHPTFLYESVWNLVGLVLIHILSKKRRFDGQVFLYYLAWYGLGRAWIEGMRTDSLYSGSLRISQVLAAVSCVLSVGALIYILCVKRPDPKKMLVNVAAEAEQATAEDNVTKK